MTASLPTLFDPPMPHVDGAPSARYIIGDTRDVTAKLPDQSVDLVMTSPPFLNLRSYLPDDHPDKAREIGGEGSPAGFLDSLLDLVDDWSRVLAEHGSIVVELGDTYSGSGGAGGDYRAGKLRDGQPAFTGSGRNRKLGDWPLPKSLCGIPTLFAWSLAYGRNLLRPEREVERWRVRNLVVWCRRNPPVGALGDKFRPATSYLVVATKASKRYFDLDAVRQPHADPADAGRERVGRRNRVRAEAGLSRSSVGTPGVSNPIGSPPLDWWQINTHPYKGAHFATFPAALCVTPIRSMCPPRVCQVCGKPSTRIVDHRRTIGARSEHAGRSLRRGGPMSNDYVVERHTVGWTDCGHDAWRRGVVLDPFAGTGTALAVAVQEGRDAVGIDLDERNAELARQRVGDALTVERFAG